MALFNKILVANRGEIAVRIIRTARQMGIRTVAVYTPPENDALFARLADESCSLGEGSLSGTYLDQEKILSIARDKGADAIHPGYGFLSENAGFVKSCADHHIVFIGPGTGPVKLMGNKKAARAFARDLGIPVIEGVESDSISRLATEASKMGFPLLVKASAGGGGIGMKVVEDQSALLPAIESASRMALSAFGDGTVYIERYLARPRHIEVQVLADQHGNVLHLSDRECSIQRRYQKIIEEAPSPSLDEPTRAKIHEAAISIARASGYTSAGTVEFLLDSNQCFYFLEMNTRIQVEHPVTECITGIDIVEQQIRIASGLPLTLEQHDIRPRGAAIEARVYAEDPRRDFMPSPGQIAAFRVPAGEGIRLDTGYDGPGMVLADFDPMIAKLIVHGHTRDEALSRMARALDDFHVQGIHTNLAYLREIVRLDDFRQNRVSTLFCQDKTAEIEGLLERGMEKVPREAFATAYVFHQLWGSSPAGDSFYQRMGYWRLLPVFKPGLGDDMLDIKLIYKNSTSLSFLLNNTLVEVRDIRREARLTRFRIGTSAFSCFTSTGNDDKVFLDVNGVQQVARESFLERSRDKGKGEKGAPGSGSLVVASPLHGRITRVNKLAGDKVTRGEALIVLESMKMENNIVAPFDGIVQKVLVCEGDQVEEKRALIEIMA